MFTTPASPPTPLRCYLETCNSYFVLILETAVLFYLRLANIYFSLFPYVRVACDQKYISCLPFSFHKFPVGIGVRQIACF